MILRDYQRAACRFVWDHWSRFEDPALLVMPTGAGKTQVFSALASKLVELDPTARVVVLAHRKELIGQAERRLRSCVTAPVGVWCGSLGRKEPEQIMVATIQSLKDFPHEVDAVIVDEAHCIAFEEETGYRRLLDKLPAHARVLGVTATPYRLGGGMLTDEVHIFSKIAYQVDMMELISEGYLVKPRLSGAPADCLIDTSGLKITAGDYNQKQLDERVSDAALLQRQIEDALPRLAGRSRVVWFATNILHAEHIAVELGVSAGIVHSKLRPRERDHVLSLFATGAIRHLVNVNIVTEGFDLPAIDAIVLLRPTASPVFYVQAVGRGLRPSPGKSDCLVLDYARVIENLGPVNAPRIPKKKGEGDGEVPMKICPECHEYVHAAVRFCPECEHEFPPPAAKTQERPAVTARILDTQEPETSPVTSMEINRHVAKSGRNCLKITYFHGFSDRTDDYLTFDSQYPLKKARAALAQLGVSAPIDSYDDACAALHQVRVPDEIMWRWEGQFKRIESRRLPEDAPLLVDEIVRQACRHCGDNGPHYILPHEEAGTAQITCQSCFGNVGWTSEIFAMKDLANAS